MKIKAHRFTVILPTAVCNEESVREQINIITAKAGGCSVSLELGFWINKEGNRQDEAIQRMTWWYETELQLEGLIVAALRLGEEEVYVEWLRPGVHELWLVTRDNYPHIFKH